MILTLTRDYYGHDATLGKLTVDQLTVDTIEPSWVEDPAGSPGGAPSVSCVPVGTYELVLHDTPKHPKTWALVNHALDIYADPTPGKRSDCLIHPANFAYQLLGCCAPGLSRMKLPNGLWMVTNSVTAFQKIQSLVPWTLGHTLVIE